MRRLYVQIYLALIAHLLLFAALAVGAWLLFDHDHEDGVMVGVAETLGEMLPAADEPVAEVELVLARLHERFGFDLSLYSPGRTFIAYAGQRLGPPPAGHTSGDWTRIAGERRGRMLSLELPDGRWFNAAPPRRSGPRFIVPLIVFLAVLALVAHPVARRITRRLERLQKRVDQLGAGDLSARIEVQGRDEVADLARSFNHAAERIEQLVDGQRTLLAAASHELRSPLARIRMAVTLLASRPDPALQGQVERDIAELDALIEELLLASRLHGSLERLSREEVDLLGLTGEEGARVDATVSGEAATVQADPRLLRHMLRNLFANAARHGAGSPIEAVVAARGEHAVAVTVQDRGPGVPEAERERIFEPFYRPAGTAETGTGVGLGLALVRQIARRHGGEVTYRAREGGGAAFEVVLERHHDPDR